MKVYSPSETAELLGIKTATLRKYSLLLEKHNYEIKRNSKRHRYYRDKDVMTLRSVIRGTSNGATLEESIKNVVNLEGHNNESNETNNARVPNTSDMQKIIEIMIKQGDQIAEQNNKIDKQSDYLIKQNELIGNLINRIDQQDKYISNNLTGPTEQEEIEEPKEVESVKTNENRKGFFAKLFNK